MRAVYCWRLVVSRILFCVAMQAAVTCTMLLHAGAVPAAAGELPVENEIAHLMAFLEKSGCEFNRNGTWYSAPKAVSHIRKKYQYLQQRGLVTTTESFIDRAASRSSMTEKPYLVRCEAGKEIASSAWFMAELDRLRHSHPVK